MRIETIKLWEDREDVELTMFLHMPDAFIPNPVKKPAFIAVPGGAYQSCPRHGNEGDPVAMNFAADGYQGFVLEYSVAGRAPEGKALFPAQLVDMGKAIVTIKEHADEWGVDPEKITICGFSAGAHLCSMYATTWHDGMLEHRLGCGKEQLRVMAALCIYGLHDYVLQEEFNAATQNMMSDGAANIPIFGSAHPDRAVLEKYSPVLLAGENMPPMFLAAATDDGLVPAMHTIRMAQRLQELHVPYECHMFRYGEHGFSLGRNLFEPFRQEMAHACAQWVPLAKTFLMHLISPETTKPEESPFKDLPLP